LQKQLHIITLNVPYPANFGGMYDLFYKLPALQQQGIKIHLHCFEYDRPQQTELNKYCASVHYYKRQTGIKGFSFKLPYIVASRNSNALTERLLEDDYPILMEGIHCTFLTNDKRFDKRKIFVRVHNIEQRYYQQLALYERNFLKRLYFNHEAALLKKYEQQLVHKATAFFTIAINDNRFFTNQLHCATASYIPLFIPWQQIHTQTGNGTFCLYHGYLGISENETAVEWLLKNVFAEINIHVVIAGKDPSVRLKDLVEKHKHVSLIANPLESEMEELINKAHIHLLPSFNNTGIKIKLLNALFNGRHCLVNSNMIDGTSLNDLCEIAETANEWKEKITTLFNQPFTADDIAKRKQLLHQHFNNEVSAKQMISLMWNE
jgi:glycosyltransferase involved in cell wall biosynthesis